ncbi:hypothetical protein EVAR_48279_1 [Eumeta japonica]|uniref:MADF domain-containing protein n=1 Tax=Eumeta variegata TaxID=151549 RepID=A0A4C1WJN8_EUMVA|nr:hypothetical protein EVAR_48279_1 [Eumeta japonica]
MLAKKCLESFSIPESNERSGSGEKLVQKRWNNIRVCFSRDLRNQKNTKSGQAAKKRKTYRFDEKLLFILPSMDTREATGNSTSNTDKDDEDTSEEEDEVSVTNKPQRDKKKGKKRNQMNIDS